MQIEFSEQEGSVTIQLINIAIKAGGLEVAEAGVIISKKIQEAFKPKETKEEEPILSEQK